MKELKKLIAVLVMVAGIVACSEEEGVLLDHYELLQRDSDFSCVNPADLSKDYFVSLGSKRLAPIGILTESEEVVRIDVYDHAFNSISDSTQTTVYTAKTHTVDGRLYFISDTNVDVQRLLVLPGGLKETAIELQAERAELSDTIRNFSPFSLTVIALIFEPSSMQVRGQLGDRNVQLNCKTSEQKLNPN